MSHYPNERGLRHNQGSGTFGESPASGPAPTTAGHHKHDILNKLDPRVDSTQDRRPAESMLNPTGGAGGNNNIPAGTYGPHNSRIANALDPRVDSDLDGRAQRGGGMPGSGTTPGMGMGTGMTGAAAAGSAGYGAGNAHVGAPEGTYGPHNSRMANALDPRVDSDRDGRGGNGMMGQSGGMMGGQTHTGSGYPHSGMTQTQQGEYGSGGAYGQPTVGGQQAGYGGSGGAGPHKSGLMNKLDPRVDSKTGTVKESKQFSERRGI
ncbi:hypothetical protein QBC34DRAFT_416302 [Podospora aff. communis PSN243]|uniref:Uncharacterized protein n=1 Tax=Podospora aff. communis PSN243 TaxID=3040156 RepID=A0AAV9G8L7_9PEZI|nr:hypothetical protein QBC34DRAFT_416302 [Podospora aff. communis PSN243]